mgnify:CR=1 FL=1
MSNRISFLAKSDDNGQFVIWILEGSFPNQSRIGTAPGVFATLEEARKRSIELQGVNDLVEKGRK